MDQESQSEQTLRSIDNISPVAMPAALKERIIGALSAGRSRIISVRKPTILLLAAGLALLIGFNVYSLSTYTHAPVQRGTVAVQPASIADEYFSAPPSI